MAAYPSDDFLLEAWVVNPHIVTLLQGLGFEEDGEWTPDNPFMRRPNPGENSSKLRINPGGLTDAAFESYLADKLGSGEL